MQTYSACTDCEGGWFTVDSVFGTTFIQLGSVTDIDLACGEHFERRYVCGGESKAAVVVYAECGECVE